MKNVLFALLETSLYAAVIAAAIALFRLAFKKRASARFQYLVWLLLIVRLLMPVTPESGLHVDALFPAPVPEQAAAGQSGGVADRQPDPALRPAAPAAQNPAAQNTAYEAAASDRAHQAPRSVKRAIGPYALGFYVWCGGVALSLFWLVFVRARFARRVLSSASPVSGEALSLYRACALLAGVKKPPRLMATREVASPSLALLGGGAAVLLPESLLGDAPALRYALLHELSHFRRGDHIVLTLCALLSALYWFNPAVWLAFSAMRADMESACDARVLELIEPQEKRAYLLTLLSLFTKSRRPALGMAQVRTARLAKKRVEDAFRASSTGGAVRVFAAVLCAALLFTCFTTACQPTPEGDVVINKGEGTLENAIAGMPAPTAEPIASSSSVHWVDEAQSDSGRVKIEIDAEIIMPNVAAHPVYRIDPCADFTQEFVTAVHRELLDGCPLVNANKEMTRTEAQEAYMKTAQRLAEFEEKGEEALSVIADGRTPAEQVEWEIAFAKEEMERYAALMKTAPETVPDAYIEADAFAKNEYGDYNFEAIPEYGQYGNRSFGLYNGNDGSRGRDWQGNLHIRLGAQYFGPKAL